MSDGGGALDQDEIERLLSGMGGGAAPTPPPPAESAPSPASDGGILSQDELNALFGGGTPSPSPPPPPPPPSPPPSAEVPPVAPPTFSGGWDSTPAAGGWDVSAAPPEAVDQEDTVGIPRGDLDYLGKRAEETLKSIAATQMNLPTEVIEFQFPEFGGTVPSTEHATLDLISEVDLDVKVELGRTYMYIEDVLKLRRGSVVPLDKMAGETVDIYINGRLLARGEVLVMNENFCIRVAELLAGQIPME